nr:MAG TPA: Major capsid protein [Microviridae sp.]
MANKQNLFSMLNLNNKVHRDGFDLSHRNCFSAKVGELLPVSVIECLPGDSFKIKTSSFTRTVPCQTSAFTRIYEYYDWYFVPYRLLQRSFNQDILRVGDDNPISARSSSDSVYSLTSTPHVSLKNIVEFLNYCGSSKNFFGFNLALQSAKLLSYLGYGDFINAYQDGKFQVNFNFNSFVSLFPLAAYQKIYMDFYRYTQWEKNKPWCYNFDYLSYGSSASAGDSSLVDISNLNFLDCLFTLRYANYPKDIFHGLLPKSQYGDVATVNLAGSGNGITNSQLVPFSGDVRAGNGESSPQLSLGSPLPDVGSGQFAVSTDSGTAENTSLHAFGKLHLPNLSVAISSLNSSFDILQLRKAQALQRWSEITQSGSYDVTDQMKKHWNVNIPEALSDRCRFIGSSKGTVTISEVINTSLNTKDDVPDVKGKGIGSSSDYTEFNTDEFGVLMCIYHAVPDIDYSLNRQSFATQRVNYSNFAIPEFDQLGLEAVYSSDLINSVVFSKADARQLFGYSPRYWQYKTNIDVVNGVFTTTRPDWCPSFGYKQLQYFYNTKDQRFVISSAFFKVDPRLLDNLFGVNVNETVNSDTFYCIADFDITVVRNLDRSGLPY